MVGASAESLILELRDGIVSRLHAIGKTPSRDLQDWRIKRVLEAIYSHLRAQQMPSQIREEFESYWPAFSQQIRAIRNDAGHPSSVAPVTEDTVHASLLVYPELAKLQNKLVDFVASSYA
ncbi:hypothetical protein [Hydrocarboniphaga sp.]|uniref:hypothetical protein n=1 Tax=Hydrocarboniphaga sp. TaxID=2033016 RepID=UPI003D11916E